MSGLAALEAQTQRKYWINNDVFYNGRQYGQAFNCHDELFELLRFFLRFFITSQFNQMKNWIRKFQSEPKTKRNPNQ